MLLAGMALPPIQFGSMGVGSVLLHLLFLTFLMNVGKCVPLATYRDEATPKERAALSLGMFPRGEVGIGVLLVSLEIFHQTGSLEAPGIRESISFAGLSLALNLSDRRFYPCCNQTSELVIVAKTATLKADL